MGMIEGNAGTRMKSAKNRVKSAGFKPSISLTNNTSSSKFDHTTSRSKIHMKTTSTFNTQEAERGSKGNSDNKRNEQISVLNMIFPYIKEEDFQRNVFKTGENWKEEAKEKPGLEVIRLNQEKRLKSNFVKKFKKFDKELNTYADTPSIRCSSAYATEDEIRRREFIKSKRFWVGKEDFKRVFGKRTLNDRDKNDSTFKREEEKSDEYKGGILLYNFRPVDKSRWVTKRDFIV